MRRIGKCTLASIATVAAAFCMSAAAQDEQVTSFSYQGQLQQAGEPYNGMANLTFRLFDAAEEGEQIGEELFFENVEVSEGLFTVPLDFGDEVFDGSPRWLEIEVGDTLLTPRQNILATPYALFALDGGGADWENVVTVAKSGGDYESVAEALNSIEPSETEAYLVYVAPGVYEETELCVVGQNVHLKGSGQGITVITSQRNGNAPNNESATAELQDNGRISHCTIENTGASGNFAIGLWSVAASRNAEINSSTVLVNGEGGVGHYAVYLADSAPTIKNCDLNATGAVGFGTAVNGALGSVNTEGGFPQPLILDSYLIGGTSAADATGTGYGMHLSETAAEIRDSVIIGGHRAITQAANGITRIRSSQVEVSSTSGAFLLETTGGGTLLFYHSGLFYVGNKLAAGSATQPSCLYSYNASNEEVNATCD